MANEHEDEEILPDDFPVFCGYAYVGDGRVMFSMLEGTVRDLKRDASVSEVRRCNMISRGML